MIKKALKSYINRLPYVKSLIDDVKLYKTDHPPGHYYSPNVNVDEIRKREKEIFSIDSNKVNAVDLNEVEQVSLVQELSKNYGSIPFSDEKQNDLRYYFKNDWYSYSDAIFLHLIIRHFKPRSIIEVGSGFSSAVMLDTNDLYFDSLIKMTFIEPYPERLRSILKPQDSAKQKILESNLQDLDLSIFEALGENDILFIDSTHVSKTNSDVNKIFFEVLPRLKRGVLIHFHDIFYPFEYPKEWVLNWKGFGWNENYILRSFLM